MRAMLKRSGRWALPRMPLCRFRGCRERSALGRGAHDSSVSDSAIPGASMSGDGPVWRQATRQWTTYCPAGDRCKMGRHRQDYRDSLEGAKSKMCHHLFNSPFHTGDHDPEQRFATWALCQTEAEMLDYDVKYWDNEWASYLDEVEYITKYGSLPEVFPEAGAGFDAEEQCDAEEQ